MDVGEREMKHTADDLKQMQSLPLEMKYLMTVNRIKAWYEHFDGMVYVSFSGGKDSTVLKAIVDHIYSDVPSVFVNTGLEYPEVRMFAMKQKNVVRIDPEMKFYEVIEKYGYPVISKEVSDCVAQARKSLEKDPNANTYRVQRLKGTLKKADGTKSLFNCSKYAFLLDAPFKVSARCCDVLKKNPVKQYHKETGRYPMTGVMAQESRMRLKNWLKHGCNAFEAKFPISNPLSFWTEQDILKFIVSNGLKIASVYGEIKKNENGEFYLTGCQRTGCMFCMFGCHLDDNPNRFQRMKQTHPKQYDYCMNQLGMSEVLNYLGVESK